MVQKTIWFLDFSSQLINYHAHLDPDLTGQMNYSQGINSLIAIQTENILFDHLPFIYNRTLTFYKVSNLIWTSLELPLNCTFCGSVDQAPLKPVQTIRF